MCVCEPPVESIFAVAPSKLVEALVLGSLAGRCPFADFSGKHHAEELQSHLSQP